MGFLGLALKCFDFLAWPLISLGYPLCASVRAIEVNSNSDMQKLITYWILYSLISLFELGFTKLIEWIPFWPYIKLTVISYLVLPWFHGAYHVYGYLVHPCFHVNPQVVIHKFNKLKELSHNGENFLAMADKYVEENGLEDLEKFIASKSKGTKPSYDVEEIKTVANTEKKEVVAAIQSKCKDAIIVQKDIKAVEQTEKNAAAAAKSKDKDPIVVQKDIKAMEHTEKNAAAAAAAKSKCEDPIVVQKDIKAVEQTEKNAAAVAKSKGEDPIVVQKEIKAVEKTEKNAAAAAKSKGKDPIVVQKDIKAVEHTEKNAAAAAATAKVKHGKSNRVHAGEEITVAAVKMEEIIATSVAGGEKKLPEITTSKEVQKEWTCAVCQWTFPSEETLKSHFYGKKHRAKWEELNASKQTNKNNGSPFSTGNKSDQSNQEPRKHRPFRKRNQKNAVIEMQQ